MQRQPEGRETLGLAQSWIFLGTGYHMWSGILDYCHMDPVELIIGCNLTGSLVITT